MALQEGKEGRESGEERECSSHPHPPSINAIFDYFHTDDSSIWIPTGSNVS